MSALIRDGFSAWRECRAEYDQLLYAAFDRAEEATSGAMLNARGRAKRIDPFTLFMGTEVRARAYASEELLEHWEVYPRVPFVVFERQWRNGREQAA